MATETEKNSMIIFFYRDADELITFEAMISINPLKRLNVTLITSKKLCQCSERKKKPPEFMLL